MTQDPNLAKIELIASALGSLRDRLVFVGGCAVGLLITDTAAAPVRVTFDVDLVARVTALAAYHGIEKEFVRLGFSREAYSDRGGADMLASHDLEDIINVLDGRPGLLEEVRNAPADLRTYLAARFAELLMAPNFLDVLPALIFPDESLAERTQVVTERIRLLAHKS